jgi:hypothetical protein
MPLENNTNTHPKLNVGRKHKKNLSQGKYALLGTQIQNRLSQVEKMRKTCRKKNPLQKREKC